MAVALTRAWGWLAASQSIASRRAPRRDARFIGVRCVGSGTVAVPERPCARCSVSVGGYFASGASCHEVREIDAAIGNEVD